MTRAKQSPFRFPAEIAKIWIVTPSDSFHCSVNLLISRLILHLVEKSRISARRLVLIDQRPGRPDLRIGIAFDGHGQIISEQGHGAVQPPPSIKVTR